jgi:hypothetical protein
MWRTIPIILLLALIPAGTFSKVPDDGLLVPGRRIGRWSLDMTVHAFIKGVGPSNVYHRPETLDLAAAYDFHCTAEICAFYRTPTELAFLQVSHIGRFARTERGPGVGSALPEVLAAYGRPTATTQVGDSFGGFTRLIYDQMGVAFRGNLITQTVVSVSIFRPGTARAIWRFHANN